ncbi:MAG: hypothetical protein JW959_03920 [Pirellulales bacterium]|nr:hypothetical protein [Pirellulales bacterium]
MSSMRPNRLLEFLAGIEPTMAVFWLGLALFTACLAVLLYTRWGQYRPLRKCMGLSVLAHLLLACYAATIQIIAPIPGRSVSVFAVSFDENAATSVAAAPAADEQPWETFAADVPTRPLGAGLPPAAFDLPAPPQRQVRADPPELLAAPLLQEVAVGGAKLVVPDGAIGRRIGPSPEPIEVPAAQRRDVAPASPDAPRALKRLAGDEAFPLNRGSLEAVPPTLLQQFAALPPTGDNDLGLLSAPPAGPTNQAAPRSSRELLGGDDTGRRPPPGGRGPPTGANVGLSGAPRNYPTAPKTLPDAYRLRVAPNKSDVARGNGGTGETEAAVAAALKWLADNQDADGRWNPRSHGGGKEMKVLGRDRLGAGSHADSAVTGLALLAFLASGNTHLDGHYAEDVRRGLEYLMRTQEADGNLGGRAAAFEFMYCHAMAACALSEAYGMTRDVRLREPVRRALAYTIAAQDPLGGGWRYRPGDPGDTSQLGWQLMTLKSAELAGIPITAKTREGIVRYLRSVSSGTYGGRASYRPGESPSRPMTAEALVCWQFLGLARQHPACNEAGDYLLEEVPGEGDYNLYYWYYATLGMYQLQGQHWQRWNEAMRDAVVARQVKQGRQAGSWDTNTVWGAYGGRVYTTALATLTLEVYYRFLPLYAEAAGAGKIVNRSPANSRTR